MNKAEKIKWMYEKTYRKLGLDEYCDFEYDNMEEEIVVKIMDNNGGLNDTKTIEELMFDYLTRDLN